MKAKSARSKTPSSTLWKLATSLTVAILLAGCANFGKPPAIIIRPDNHTTILMPGQTATITATNQPLYIMDPAGLLLQLGIDPED